MTNENNHNFPPTDARCYVAGIRLFPAEDVIQEFVGTALCGPVISAKLPKGKVQIQVDVQFSGTCPPIDLRSYPILEVCCSIEHQGEQGMITSDVRKFMLEKWPKMERTFVLNIEEGILKSDDLYSIYLRTSHPAFHGAVSVIRFKGIRRKNGFQEFVAQNEISDLKHCHANAMDELNSMIGLQNVKDAIYRTAALCAFNIKREDLGITPVQASLHSMFVGSPGTGKTTVAKLLGQILHDIGALSRGHVVVKERASLVTENYGGAEAMVTKAIHESMGGILFIDEAYLLCNPHDPRDPGKDVINSLLTAMGDPKKKDWMVILAGYTKQTLAILNSNPGLRSRINSGNIYEFADYSAEELIQIAHSYLDRYQLQLTSEAETKLQEKILADYATKDETFGNARYVTSLIENQIAVNMAMRVKESNDLHSLSVIEACDIPEPNAPQSKPRLGFC